MNPHVNAIANRLSLRPPQRTSLEILDRLGDIVPLHKDLPGLLREDPAGLLQVIQSEYPGVTDFERDFPSVCFALATGVGKTRLMGAFIAYLHLAHGLRHFFVLAPNLTIYDKLIRDFTPNTPKYVFQGLGEFAAHPPEVITGDNYESGRGVRGLFERGAIHVNIFNISKINAEVRGNNAPRIKRLSEYIGQSYFDYLAGLDDLVLLMDESHRYRASAGVRAINDLRPVLGLELTATPQVERGGRAEPFKNVIYDYPLATAMRDGFVKEPAVATRENFRPDDYDEVTLERLKLEDGIKIHEHTKTLLEVFAHEHNRPLVKPFMLVVAKDTAHADALVQIFKRDDFAEGRYQDKVITVHSNLRGEEKDDTVAQLLAVEQPENPTEVVIHVNMLKEGWDVTNLYTIVPLRAANSRTLVEQSIGRGLRLPFGRRVGIPALDRLTIVAHDKFQEIVDDANRPDSLIRATVVLGRDVPNTPTRVVTIEPRFVSDLSGFGNPKGLVVARATLDAIRQHERLPSSAHLQTPEVQRAIVEQVTATLALTASAQPELEGVGEKVDTPRIVAETVSRYLALSIDVPRITLVPIGAVTAGFRPFTLDFTERPQPVAQDILMQNLRDQAREKLHTGQPLPEAARPEDYLVQALMGYDDVNYEQHAALLYDLAGQRVAHLRSYLANEDEVTNVLQYHQRHLAELIHTQMLAHYEEHAAGYEARVTRSFITLRASTHALPADQSPRPFRQPVDERLYIREMLFEGFTKCLYSAQKFDSDSERRLAVILESDPEVLKWVKPPRGQIQIDYRDGAYEPDFVVETQTIKYLCEPKRADQMDDPEVLAKAKAAARWCHDATLHEQTINGKPWVYLLIPHDAISENMTLAGLAAAYTFAPRLA